ncbi:hypothetical protein NWF24_26760 [Variovorax paradoxus]|uniref:hypothetical protein n=1 Tax=Variovorax paradoxus TaxID=34073 RepID=UPI0021AC5B3C|nr:hypothetical protein [Variovorax paradoxus]UVH56415.1 hypothetical protein NWF24_26760 [Variovorax paradoxus]
MNRCKTITNALTFIAVCTAAIAAAGLFPLTASAQDEVPRPQTQNESLVGGRTFPIGTLRGKFMVTNAPDVELDGKADRLGAGARIRSGQNMLVMPGAIVGQKYLVNYTRDAAGLLREVWILTPDEAMASRESLDKPLLNIWPFTSNDTVNTQ